jgi:hypothetical protein
MYWACDQDRKMRIAYRILERKPLRKQPLGRRRRRWDDSIKIDLREVGFSDESSSGMMSSYRP